LRIGTPTGDLGSTDREDYAAFRGLVIAIRHRGLNSSFMIRGIFEETEIEQQFPFYSPWIRDMQILDYFRHSRNKMYHMRESEALVPGGTEIFLGKHARPAKLFFKQERKTKR